MLKGKRLHFISMQKNVRFLSVNILVFAVDVNGSICPTKLN